VVLFVGCAGQLTELLNRQVIGLIESPRWGRFLNRNITRITYEGRKSAKIFSLPVGYLRIGDTVTIRSQIRSDQKSWWRNFVGAGAPLTIWLDGAERAGHAVAVRDDRGQVAVTVTLNDAYPAGDTTHTRSSRTGPTCDGELPSGSGPQPSS
jgi:hypothetical protein